MTLPGQTAGVDCDDVTVAPASAASFPDADEDAGSAGERGTLIDRYLRPSQ